MKPTKTAGEVMVTRMVTLSPDMVLCDAARLLVKHHVGSAPVVDRSGVPLGELSRQICTDALLDAVYEEFPANEVSAYVLPWKISITENASVLEMAGKFRDSPQRFLPVIRDGRFVGVVTRSALIRAVLEFLETMPDPKACLLYLSAVRDGEEVPEQVT